MKPEDFIAQPCACPACEQAGVSDRDQIRDRVSGAWLHGYDLKRWYEAKDAFWRRFHETVAGKGMAR